MRFLDDDWYSQRIQKRRSEPKQIDEDSLGYFILDHRSLGKSNEPM